MEKKQQQITSRECDFIHAQPLVSLLFLQFSTCPLQSRVGSNPLPKIRATTRSLNGDWLTTRRMKHTAQIFPSPFPAWDRSVYAPFTLALLLRLSAFSRVHECNNRSRTSSHHPHYPPPFQALLLPTLWFPSLFAARIRSCTGDCLQLLPSILRASSPFQCTERPGAPC